MTPTQPGHGAAPLPPTMPFSTFSHTFASNEPRSRPVLLAGRPPLPTACATRPSGRLDREMIRRSLMLRCERLAELEEQMVEGCNAAAERDHHKAATATPRDRRRWDRAAWGRYLDAAARLEISHGPRMRRLRDDIARLERLLDLPVTA